MLLPITFTVYLVSNGHIVHVYRMRAALDELCPGNGIKILLSEDGSGRGAAIVAAVACRLEAAGEYK